MSWSGAVLAGFKLTTLLKLGVGSRAAANAVAARKAPIAIRRWTRESPAFQMVAQRKDSARSGPTPAPRAAPAPWRSQASPASAKSLRARARGQRGLRRDGRSIGRAWRALATRAARRFGHPGVSRSRGRFLKLLRPARGQRDRVSAGYCRAVEAGWNHKADPRLLDSAPKLRRSTPMLAHGSAPQLQISQERQESQELLHDCLDPDSPLAICENHLRRFAYCLAERDPSSDTSASSQDDTPCHVLGCSSENS